jgi:hypothetical protein
MALHVATQKTPLQWPESQSPRADQPYFSMAEQPEGNGIKGGGGAVGERVKHSSRPESAKSDDSAMQ